jgi:Hsp20/alpha crystallin family
MLTIKGEKREEKEEQKQDYYIRERSFGSFERPFPVPDGVDLDKVDNAGWIRCDEGRKIDEQCQGSLSTLE